MEGDVIGMQDIFVFERRGIDENGKVKGAFHSTGIIPKFSERLKTGGFHLRPAIFDSTEWRSKRSRSLLGPYHARNTSNLPFSPPSPSVLSRWAILSTSATPRHD